MKEYTFTMNGQPVKVSNNFNAEIYSAEELKDFCTSSIKEGSLDFDIPVNPLWKRQQETGVPRGVHLSFLCNL